MCTTSDEKPPYEIVREDDGIYYIIIDGQKYTTKLGPKGCKPCEHCAVKHLCDTDDRYLMLCGCAFVSDPWYIIKVEDKQEKND